MASYSWKLASSGDWNVASNCSPSGGPPKSMDTATISATGSAYAVTVDSADVASSLTLSSANATLDDHGRLDFADDRQDPRMDSSSRQERHDGCGGAVRAISDQREREVLN